MDRVAGDAWRFGLRQPVNHGAVQGIQNNARCRSRYDVEGRPFRAAFYQNKLLAEMSATVFATEPGSRLTDEAIAPAIPIIVTVAIIITVTVIVCI